jgi:hypothetical protein
LISVRVHESQSTVSSERSRLLPRRLKAAEGRAVLLGLIGLGPAADAKDMEITVLRPSALGNHERQRVHPHDRQPARKASSLLTSP